MKKFVVNLGEVPPSKPEDRNFKFYEIFSSKRYIDSAKNFGRSFIL